MRIPLLLAVLLLTACAVDEPHGSIPTTAPNLPAANGDLAIRSETVTYHDGVSGYYAYPEDEGDYPGVVMIHEWWGLNENIMAMADQLAREGYRVLAVDLFNGNVAQSADEARRLTGNFSQEEGLANMQSAVGFLRGEGSEQVASLGWCFGGGQSLQLGINENLEATVMYYGQVVTDTGTLQSIEQPVLGIFAEQDTGIPPEQVRQFEAALDEIGVDNAVHIYPGVNHAFANPSGDRYAPEAAEDAWQKTTAFLAENLK